MKLASAAAAIVLADFLTAAAHWFEDTYLPWTDTPGILGDIARDNEMHHAVPFTITSVGWWANVKVSIGLLAVAGVALGIVAPRFAVRHARFLAVLAVAMGASNLLHRFQHERDCTRPAVVTLLQHAGILCDRNQHVAHHADPTGRYSVLLGFTNVVYDGLGVWRALEVVLRVAGMRPVRKPEASAYDMRDPWLDRNMQLRCPERIPAYRVDSYKHTLAISAR